MPRPSIDHRACKRILASLALLLAIPISLFACARPVSAQIACSGSHDYGDAPDSYGDACATPTLPVVALQIGSTLPDAEAGSQHSSGADGDDTSGTDDEGFLNPLTPVDIAYTQYVWSVPVSNVDLSLGPGYLRGWIDFDGNGSFDSNELAAADVPLLATVATLTWNVPATAQPNTTTYARIRISHNSSLGPVDDGGVGEVEDYQVSIVESLVCAPGRSFYFIDGTTANDATIRSLDLATGAVTTLNNPASQARVDGIAVDESRGIVYYQDASADSSSDGIYYWDAVNGTQTTGNGTVTNDAGSSPLSLPLGNGWTTAAAAFANGKLYVGIDGDDLGTIYEITLDAAGTGPVSSRALFTPNAGCLSSICRDYGDLIVAGNRMYVSYRTWGLLVNNAQHVDVYDINSQTELDQWSSSANSNDWAYQLARDGNGQIYALRQDNGNVYTVNEVDGSINLGSAVGTTGVPVFDAAECPVVPMDFGDAPQYYGTDVGPRSARHGLNANLRLGNVSGATTIRDLHGFSSVDANGDDAHTYNGGTGGADDEDSVTTVPQLTLQHTVYTIPNIVVFNNTGSNATLYGWVDFNRDGQFQQTERASVTVSSNPATQTAVLNWYGLSGLTVGPTYLRLRLSTAAATTSHWGSGNDGAFLATGYASDGEIEDYAIDILEKPTAVSLSSFSAHALDAQSQLSEFDWRLPAACVCIGVSVGTLAWVRHKHR